MAQSKPEDNQKSTNFPPVVAVLGHVDHGKTTLLDAIRSTSIAAREIGGITQKIGASSVELMHEGKKRSITFIDTPGHEAFSKMRGRGAQAADLALLIIAATEGLKPQTRESIEILKQTGTPYIVVLTKVDLPAKNSEKVKQELLQEQVTLESFGGEIPSIEVSAKTNLNIKELLDLILLMTDLHKTPESQSQISGTSGLNAIVIESKLDPKVGPRATVVIKNGTIHVRDDLQTEGQVFKVRSLQNDKSQQLKEASVGEAVEILGFEKVPNVGSLVAAKSSALIPQPENGIILPLKKELIYQKKDEEIGITAILITDTQGSLEAIVNALPPEIRLLTQKTGEVTEADILHAKSTGSIVLSFNTKIRPEVAKLAITEKILLRNYTIIYEMLDEVKDALEGKILSQMEQIFGEAKVLAKFPFEKTFAIGIHVNTGRVARGDRIRIHRGESVLGESAISSLRVGKNTVSKVEKGHEAGILISVPLDIQVGDVIISHS